VSRIKNSNDIYFDLIEYLDYKEDKFGNPIFCEIYGEIKVENLLTGINKI
jgi:hypothetical protein